MYDLFIIGGGINGSGIARDAVGRGLKVCLVEKNTIGSATSSWSTKLIHGGLRYLENYEFKLVRESLKEREIIFKIAKDITEPIPFIIPHTSNLRPRWIIKLGLFIYDRLGGKSSLSKSSSINIHKDFPGILKKEFSKGFKYYDLHVDDKRLTYLNAESAKEYGAKIFENTKIIKINRLKNHWKITLGGNIQIKSKILINASGPWVNQVNEKLLNYESLKKIRLVKGSHLIFNKLYKDNIAFTLQNIDNRIIFVIPYKDKFTLVGTTEIEVKSPNNPKIDEIETDYLLNTLNYYFEKKITKEMILSSYSGIRPLIEDFKSNASNITRDYIFDINQSVNQACLINIYGGKLTTYRKLSENLIDNLKDFFPNIKNKWTDKINL